MKTATYWTYDPAPVLELARRQLVDAGWTEGETFTQAETTVDARHRIADLCGVAVRTVHRWQAGETRIPEWRADRIALRLGTHHALLWDDWWHE